MKGCWGGEGEEGSGEVKVVEHGSNWEVCEGIEEEGEGGMGGEDGWREECRARRGGEMGKGVVSTFIKLSPKKHQNFLSNMFGFQDVKR